jgi:hypothetical protein
MPPDIQDESVKGSPLSPSLSSNMSNLGLLDFQWGVWLTPKLRRLPLETEVQIRHPLEATIFFLTRSHHYTNLCACEIHYICQLHLYYDTIQGYCIKLVY